MQWRTLSRRLFSYVPLMGVAVLVGHGPTYPVHAAAQRSEIRSERIGAGQTQDGELRGRAEAVEVTTARLRASVEAAVRLLQAGGTKFQDQVKGACFSCHHQSLPAMAAAMARERGLAADEQQAQAQYDYVHRRFEGGRGKLGRALRELNDKEAQEAVIGHFPGADMTMGYGLLGLAAWDRRPDPTTEAAARFLARRQRQDGRWEVECTVRAPSEDSDFTATAVAVRVLRAFVPDDRSEEMTPRLARAREWLERTPARTTEDRTFRLLGLVWAGASTKDRHVRETMKSLLAEQREDGGWGQIPTLKSDAYATGETLYALHQAGEIPVPRPAYQRGIRFLLRTQAEDGSWHVRSRARPFQGFVETGFPYGKDQFISATATSWAAMALALAIPTATR